MRLIFAPITFAVVALAFPLAAPAHQTRFSWTEFQAEQRLTVGRFAAANAVKYATCLGTGTASGPSYGRRFKHFECSLRDKELTSERQIVLHVRGETTFAVEWLTAKDC